MLARLRKTMDEKDNGFTLIELLVVMIIIGILAAIAIPVFLNQKKKAAETSAKADASNISREVAASLTDGNPTAITLTNGDNSTGTSVKTATLKADSDPATDVKVGAGNKATLTYAAGVYCVIVAPALSGAATWSAGPGGLSKTANCGAPAAP